MAADGQYSDGHIAPPDFYNLIAKHRGCPDGWRWVNVKAVGESRKEGAVIANGAVYPEKYKSGKRKGATNYGKPTPGTERELLVTFADLDAFQEQWERDNSSCRDCGGSKETLASSHVNGAKTYRPCSRCNATGRAQP